MTRIGKPLASAGRANQQGASINCAQDTSSPTGQVEVPLGNSAAFQKKRILSWISHPPLTTLKARQHLDCMHPAAHVMELRKHGVLNFAMEEM